ncbi:hypothetical protein RISK_003207 [Rhodopirellula islandica]|uniref:Uncharacterized protein n=1 Tax=Rhodopirellula islandica TaxID=595434 RepID=A0A0J1EHG1_RHOIS|nr:hypothetical protein RISK_003207 [Rhodopirellula islandica]
MASPGNLAERSFSDPSRFTGGGLQVTAGAALQNATTSEGEVGGKGEVHLLIWSFVESMGSVTMVSVLNRDEEV